MKKNTMLRVASVLVIAVLLTTCSISGTFAKYTSNTFAESTARVAKWGWGDTAVTLELFKTTYDNDVASANTDKVIAPGTSNAADIAFVPASSFKPEVDYKITFAAEAVIPDDVEAELDWTLAIDGAAAVEYDTFTALKAALEAKEYSFDANSAPSIDVAIGWEWEFDGDDAADTALGNKATLDELTVKVTLTATQVNA